MLRLALAAIVATLLAAPASAQTADTVLFNGKVVTVDTDFSIREAIVVANGRVLATGTSVAMKKLAGEHARMIDLGGRTVIPGPSTASAPR
jgi:predicted amidohydrolase YtcJ